MDLFHSFKNSLLLPKKEALFRLNRVSMRNTLVYVLLLSFILVIIDISQTVGSSAGNFDGMPRSMYYLQLITVYPFFIFFLVIAGISIFAAGAVLLREVFQRKLAYHYLWKMTAFSLTIPLLAYSVLTIFSIDNNLIKLSPFLYLFFLLYKIIVIYPKKKS